MKDLKERLKSILRQRKAQETFTAQELQVPGPLTVSGVKTYSLEEIEEALKELVKDRFLTEAKLERRRGRTTYRVTEKATHPWRKTQARRV